ncbi:MAG: hypothetical protein U0835_20965 [Isosphaeraceae bacterium]
MISPTVVVGYGLAGRAFHCPLIARQQERGMALHGVVARDPKLRAGGLSTWGVVGYASLDEAPPTRR